MKKKRGRAQEYKGQNQIIIKIEESSNTRKLTIKVHHLKLLEFNQHTAVIEAHPKFAQWCFRKYK